RDREFASDYINPAACRRRRGGDVRPVPPGRGGPGSHEVSGFPRNVTTALGRSYDLIVVGGGIYGITLVLEAARRGLRPLLVERDDFASAASLNGLRILHGGLRYLQSMDLPRFFESVEQ